MISVADACATCECIGQTSPKFDFRIQPAAEVLSVCERKHNLVLAFGFVDPLGFPSAMQFLWLPRMHQFHVRKRPSI